MWTPLPDGALKRQILVEIADHVQLASRELIDLWTSVSNANPHFNSSRHAGGRSFVSNEHPDLLKNTSRRPRLTGRAPPISRADHATRLLLGHMAALDLLSAEDHSMLCDLPEPHGALFVWLEGQLHEHGAQPWVALREGLRGHEQEQLAVQLMTGYELGPAEEADATLMELRNLLNRMLVERLKVQETQAIQEAKADPSALLRYRELQARRRQLEAGFSAAPDLPDLPSA